MQNHCLPRKKERRAKRNEKLSDLALMCSESISDPESFKQVPGLGPGLFNKAEATRESMVSNISYDPSEIGRAISVIMVNSPRTKGGVKQTFVEQGLSSKPITDDEQSVYSGSVKLGRLDTIKSVATGNVQPDLTVTTAVENVIPPRLKRRPISRVPVQAESIAESSRSTKRSSLTINEDLDKLMESASSLTEESNRIQDSTTRAPNLSDVSEKPLSDLSVSSDMYETAEGDFRSSPNSSSTSGALKLPKRPNAVSLGKARQAYLEFSATNAMNSEKKTSSEVLSVRTGSSFLSDDDFLPKDQQHKSTGKSVSLIDCSKFTASVELYPDQIDSGRSKLSSRTKLYAPGVEESNVPDEKMAGEVTDPLYEKDAVNTEDAIDAEIVPRQVLKHEKEVKPVPIPKEETINSPDPQAEVDIIPSLPGPIDASSMEEPTKHAECDNEYYDLDEPALMSRPSRAKSVKDNTRLGKKKSARRGKKNRKSAELKLKPFSYSTLVNLLESINGTVIGEEFNSLNLPVQEKQLIERIIDLLSRLTSDMIIDESRYAVGIARLEKAHRVLEGFM